MRLFRKLTAFSTRFLTPKRELLSFSSSTHLNITVSFNYVRLQRFSTSNNNQDPTAGQSGIEKPSEKPAKETFVRTFENLTVDMYQELITSKEDEQLIKSILEDYEYVKYTTEKVPSKITIEQMKNVMKVANNTQKRESHFRYLYKIEMAELNDQIRKERKRLEREERKKIPLVSCPPGIHFDPETNAPIYGIWRNALFINFDRTFMDKAGERNQLFAALYGQPLVLDFSFEHLMDNRSFLSVAEQVTDGYGFNKTKKQAFQLYFCNYKNSGPSHETMTRVMPNLGKYNNLTRVEERSYLDIFPKENLVYLSPDAKTPLTTIEEDAIYIIGVLNDRSIKKNVTLQKAKSERIRWLRLPLEEYMSFSQSTNLTVDQTLKILVTFKETKDWTKALQWVPRRKLKSEQTIREEQEYRKNAQMFKRMKFTKQQ